MNCPLCRGKLERGTITFPVMLDGVLLIIKNVPADVCNQCGEEFIPNTVAKIIEKTVEGARSSKAEIEIISYEKVA